MSAGKDGLPNRSSVDSALKLFGRTIPISVSQDLTILKHGKSSDSREAGECRVLDAKQEEKNFKKPEKIVPCPRCESSDTKFCYFNNYNVNQPRHFCKNCHRYWTAGGTMRNVPVGAGRRRNKHFASQPPNSNTHLRSLPKSMDPPFEEASTSGSSITTASNTMNEFSKPEASEHCYLVSPRWHPPATVNISDAYVVNCKWQCETGNDGGAAILGKHCREAKLVEEGRRERSVLAPKTLRLDDPKEASKSPIWASLGFKPYSLETKF